MWQLWNTKKKTQNRRKSKRGINIQKSLLSNAAWNTVGTTIYYACQFLVTLIVVWIYDGFENAGNLGLAMNISNLFFCIAAYNLRAYQVSDVHNEYPDSAYVAARIVTCAGALLICAVFVLIPGYTLEQMLIIISYMGFRVVEAFIDVLHGIVHKRGRLDYAGISMIARGLLMVTVFSILSYISTLLTAIIGMIVVTALFGVLYDVPKARKMAEKIPYTKKQIKTMLVRCFPLMMVMFMIIFYAAYTRFALERIRGTDALGTYITATTPAIALQMAVTFMLAPLMNLFASCVKESDKARFMKIFTISAVSITGFTILAVFVAHIAGRWGLTLVFGAEIEPYAYLLPAAVVGTGLTALLWFFNVVFSSVRDIRGLFYGCIAGVVVCITAAEVLIRAYGDDGANYAMIISQAVVMLIFCARLVWNLRKRKIL